MNEFWIIAGLGFVVIQVIVGYLHQKGSPDYVGFGIKQFMDKDVMKTSPTQAESHAYKLRREGQGILIMNIPFWPIWPYKITRNVVAFFNSPWVSRLPSFLRLPVFTKEADEVSL